MKKTMWVYFLVFSLLVNAALISVYATDNAEKALQNTPSITSFVIIAEDTAQTVTSILNANAYDRETVYAEGLKMIALIAERIEAFGYWEQGEITSFHFLRSFETGHVTHALFEIRGQNGKSGFMIYDCKDKEADTFAASCSPYQLAIDAVKNGTVAAVSKAEPYLFYGTMSYGYGVLNENGLLDIYNVRSMIAGTKAEILTDVSFASEESEMNEDTTVKTADPSASEYEIKLTQNNARDVYYPTSYLIPNVPDYQQSTGCLCIPTSMSNILSYWDQNGFPNLVPASNDSNRETYIKTNIVAYLQQQAGGTGSNSSIDPAFSAYVSANGKYYYTGISAWNPLYEYLLAEIYSFENPCMVGFPYVYGDGHSTTGVGYDQSVNEMVIVHDNHNDTPVDVYQSWEDVDYLFSFNIR